MDHLTKELIIETCERISVINGSLHGLGSLLVQPVQEAIFDDGDLGGLGKLLKKLAEELGILEDLLRCGNSAIGDQINFQIKISYEPEE